MGKKVSYHATEPKISKTRVLDSYIYPTNKMHL